ncbi:hypothetical protein AB0N29_07740 [Nocardioides sp. NPDC092400]|uniref:hypothetical protein n=1 Tax=Nocardioides sp. NPDC092400 TaxID=3155196 RepID=UPI00342BF498
MTGPETVPDPREEEVRRLLADVRHAEPVPVDVAARLDRVLAQLAEGEDVPSSADELAVRRRRRAAGLLAAAAVVTVVGLGLGQVLPAGSGNDDSTSAGSSAAGGGAAEDGGRRDGGGGSTQDRTDGVPGEAAPRPSTGSTGSAPGAVQDESAFGALVASARRPVRLRSDRFAADALRARDRVDAGRTDVRDLDGGLERDRPRGTDRRTDGAAYFECTPADWGAGAAVPVLYDGEPHVLVFRAPAGDSQVADLLQCGTGDILRSTTLPAD